MELRPLAREGEELVAIVFVLFFAGGDLGGQPLREVMAERIKAVEDGDDFCLRFERRDGDGIFIQHRAPYRRHRGLNCVLCNISVKC